MIYSDRFVWLHFPKCAGVKIEYLFDKYLSGVRGLHLDAVGIDKDPTIAWHDGIKQREKRDPNFKLGTRTVICSFRRLPSWLESRYNFEFQRSPDLPHQPELLLDGVFLEYKGHKNNAENYVNRFMPEELLASAKVMFLRTEFFAHDFKKIFGEYMDISSIPDWEFEKKVNTSECYLPAEIKEKLYHSHEIYDKCPRWKKIEKLAYK